MNTCPRLVKLCAATNCTPAERHLLAARGVSMGVDSPTTLMELYL
jgi:hypothetical protein